MAGLGDLIARVGANIDGYMSAMDQVVSKAGSTADQVERRFEKFETLGAAMAKIGVGLTAGLTVPIVGIGTAALTAAGDMEQARIGFTTLLRSGDAATQMLENLRDFAAKTPFQFTELVTSAQRLMALGFAANEVIPTLQAVGNAVSAMGKGSDAMDRIILQLGQMRNSARLSGSDMKSLIENGVEAWRYLSDATGIAMTEIQEKARDVLTGAQAADIILRGMATQFAGGMEAQSQSMLGMWSNVKDAIGFALADIGKALLPTAKLIIESFILPTIEGLKSLAEWFGGLPQPVQMGALALAGLAAAAGPVLVAIGAIGMALPAVSAGLTALGALGPLIMSMGGALTSTIAVLGRFALTAVPAAIAAMATFTTSTLPSAIAAIGSFSTALLVNAARALTTFATTSVPAAVMAVYTFATTAIPAAITAVVAFATTAIPAAISALVTFATTSIPAAISALVTFATTGVAGAGAALTSFAAAAVPVAIGALSALSVAALAVGAAFLGWKIGEWALSHIPGLQRLNDKIGDIAMQIPILNSALLRWSGIQKITDDSTQVLADSTEKLRKFLASKGVTVERGSLSLEEYNKKLRQAATELNKAGGVTKTATKTVQDHSKAVGAAGKAHKDAEPNVKKMTQAQADHIVKLAGLRRGLDEATDELLLLDAQIRSGRGPIELFARALDGVKVSLSALMPDFGTFSRVMDAVGRQASETADAFGAAMSRLRITSSTELKATADSAAADYERISNSGIATKGEIEQAWRAMTEAQIAYRRSIGEDVSALEEELAKQEQAHRSHGQQVRTVWGQIGEDISRAFDQASLRLSDAMRDLFTGEFSFSKVGDAFKELGLNIASAFLDVGAKAITDFIKNHIGALLEALGGLLSRLPVIGDALGGVFGRVGGAVGGTTGGGVAGSVGGAAGGVGGAAGAVGSGASSLAGWIAAGAGVASAISGIIGNFQNARQENTLNAIEESTRYSKAYDLLSVTLALEYWPFLKSIDNFLWTAGIQIWTEAVSEIQVAKDYLRDLIFKAADMINIALVTRDYTIATYEMLRDGLTMPNVSLAPLVVTGSAAPGGITVNIDMRGSTISDDATARRIGQMITDQIRSVIR